MLGKGIMGKKGTCHVSAGYPIPYLRVFHPQTSNATCFLRKSYMGDCENVYLWITATLAAGHEVCYIAFNILP